MSPRIIGTGIRATAPGPDIRDRRLAAADRPGQHLWAIFLTFQCDPERFRSGSSYPLDTENLIMASGPGCLKCELEYSRKLARLPCRGSVTDLQPPPP